MTDCLADRWARGVLAVSLAVVVSACQPKSPPAELVGSQSRQGQLAGPQATIHVVCPADSVAADCRYKGGGGIQAAVDAAVDGDTITLKAGRYTAEGYRDIPYKIHTIRGFVVVDGKDLMIRGEPGTVLDGSTGAPTTAFVIRRAKVTLQQLTLSGFRFDVEEDETYEGHGVFAIDSRVRLNDVTIAKYQKMALTGRGDSMLEATNLRILDGHVAIWLHESAYLRLSNALIRGNDSSGIAAYDNSVAHVANSVFDGNLDDALYTEHEAALYVSNSLLLRNKPYAARALGHSRIWLGYTGLFGNANATVAKGKAAVGRGPNVVDADPRIDANYRLQPGSPLTGKGDPELGSPRGAQQFGPLAVAGSAGK